jgi:hypothetical protein
MLRGGKEEAVEGLKLEGICSRSKEWNPESFVILFRP